MSGMYTLTQELPAHLRDWQLPPGWCWGAEGLNTRTPSLPGARRRARPVAVAGERAGPVAQHVAGGGGSPPGASQPSGDADDVPLLGVVRAEPSRPRISATLDRRRNRGDATAAHGHRRRSRRASPHARNRVGTELPPRPRRRAGLHVARHGVDDANGPALDHRMAVGDAGDRDSRPGSRQTFASWRCPTSGPTAHGDRRRRATSGRSPRCVSRC